jgi:hypothetical protein
MAVAADLHRDFLIPARFFRRSGKLTCRADPCYSFVLLLYKIGVVLSRFFVFLLLSSLGIFSNKDKMQYKMIYLQYFHLRGMIK